MTLPSRYGQGLGLGRYLPTESKLIPVTLLQNGMKGDKAVSMLQDGEMASIVNFRSRYGGLSLASSYVQIGTSAAQAIRGLGTFWEAGTTVRTIRVKQTQWDYWNGAVWTALAGAVADGGEPTSGVVVQDTFIIPQRTTADRLKKVVTVAAGVVDLSADAPIAKNVALLGTRLVAGPCFDAGAYDYDRLQWCADGIFTDWTTQVLGAGAVELNPEGAQVQRDQISTLCALPNGLLVGRERSLVIGTRTGIGSQPFRWSTFMHNLGISALAAKTAVDVGDGIMFLGNDLVVYFFDGQSLSPVSEGVGLKALFNYANAFAATFDTQNKEYILTAIASSSGVNFVFDVGTYKLTGKMLWYRDDSVGFTVPTAIGFGADTSANQEVPLIGTSSGQVARRSPSNASANFAVPTFVTRQLGSQSRYTEVDRVYLHMSVAKSGTVNGTIEVSTDGGVTWPVSKSWSVSNGGVLTDVVVGVNFALTFNTFQFRVKVTDAALGTATNITLLEFEGYDRGRVAA